MLRLIGRSHHGMMNTIGQLLKIMDGNVGISRDIKSVERVAKNVCDIPAIWDRSSYDWWYHHHVQVQDKLAPKQGNN